MDILHTGTEILIGKSDELFDKVFGILCGDVLAGEHAVDEYPQLRIGEFTLLKITADTGGADVIACLFQQGNVAPDGFALYLDAVLAFEVVCDVLIGQQMLGIAVFAEYLQYAQKCKFFRLNACHLYCLPLFQTLNNTLLLCREACYNLSNQLDMNLNI